MRKCLAPSVGVTQSGREWHALVSARCRRAIESRSCSVDVVSRS